MPFMIHWTEHWWEEHTGRALRKQRKTTSGPYESTKRAEEVIRNLKGLALSWGTGFVIERVKRRKREWKS